MDSLRSRIFALFGIPIAGAGVLSGPSCAGHGSAASYPPLGPSCGPDEGRNWHCSYGTSGKGPRAPEPFDECSATLGEDRFDARRTALQRDQTSDDACCYSGPCRAIAAAPSGSFAGGCGATSCVDPPEGGTRFPAKDAPGCPAALEMSHMGPDRGASAFAGLEGGKCCYSVPAPCRGRPVTGRDGEALVAPPVRTTAWLGPDVAIDAGMAPAIRRAAAERWLADAALEHASVASFAWLVLDLMALGAPADLVEAAHHAALDEVRHARQSFAIASTLAGAPRGPGALPFPGREPAASHAELADRTLREGCIEETVAAVVARVSASAAATGPIADVLAAIADDEERHAELAWRILAWTLMVGAEDVAEKVEIAARDVRAELAAGPRPGGSQPVAALARAGVLDEATRAAVRREVLQGIVAPCLRHARCTRDGKRADIWREQPRSGRPRLDRARSIRRRS